MVKSEKIEVLDTTLRDGAQANGISFSLQDKLGILRALDELGIDFIEAGNPGSNPKDMEFFNLAKEQKLEHSKLLAFGSTKKKKIKASEDNQIKSLLDAKTEGVVIFGKAWDLHVREVLQVSLEENLNMIQETVSFLKDNGRFVIFDAEHFFDGWVANADYSLSALKIALDAGADRIVLCDTNGGTFPDTIAKASAEALKALGVPDKMGIHTHNDIDMASANTLAAVNLGFRHIQGTLAGFGERCGNACLASLIPSLELKLKFTCLPKGKLERISSLTRKIAEISNIVLSDNMPYIGSSAFSHKAGMHADGVLKITESFEHVDPALVGNDRHILMSEVVGRSAITERINRIDPTITKEHPVTLTLIKKLKKLEAEGWAFEGADASFDLFIRRELGRYESLFKIEAYRVVSEHPTGETISCSHAWVKVLVDGQYEIAAAEGDGPVNAMDNALRRALQHFFPELEQMRLSDYKVRVIDGNAATAAKVRVLINSSDGERNWMTVGVSEDIIEASRAALTDSIEYKLIGDFQRKFKAYL